MVGRNSTEREQMKPKQATLDHANRILAVMESMAEKDRREPPSRRDVGFVSDIILYGDEFLQMINNCWKMKSITRTAFEYLVSIGKVEKVIGWSRSRGNTYYLITPERIAWQQEKLKKRQADDDITTWLESVGFPMFGNDVQIANYLKSKGIQ